MMLWNIIRDFIVEHITGGTNSSSEFFNTDFGVVITYFNGEYDDSANLTPIPFQVSSQEGYTYYVSAQDWLATTLTIIAMCLIVAFAIWLVRWVFKAVTSAFLLRR